MEFENPRFFFTPTRSDLHARWRVLFCPLESGTSKPHEISACAKLRWAGRRTQAASTALTSSIHSTSITHPQPGPKPQSPKPHSTNPRGQARPHEGKHGHSSTTCTPTSCSPRAGAHTQAKSSAGPRPAATRKPASSPSPSHAAISSVRVSLTHQALVRAARV